jgi:hypothetical protein
LLSKQSGLMYSWHLSGGGSFDKHFPFIAACISFTKCGFMEA